MEQLDLLKYPQGAGYKRAGTSQDAAKAITPRALSLKIRVYELLTHEALTADEAAARLGEDRHSVRSRISELAAENPPRAYDIGFSRPNKSGLQAIVWRARR